jgi:hypothetical protein
MNKDNTRRKKSTTDSIKNQGYCRKQFYVSAFAVFLTFGTLAAYIIVSNSQNEKTRKSLELTKRSIDLADSNFVIENRAWVGVEHTSNAPSELSVDIRNFGKTPAENLCHGDTALLCHMTPTKRPHVIIGKATSISPDGRDNIVIPSTFSDEVFQTINEGKIGICYYGIITYTDIYGRRDTTEFMYMFNSLSSPQLQRIGINRMK